MTSSLDSALASHVTKSIEAFVDNVEEVVFVAVDDESVVVVVKGVVVVVVVVVVDESFAGGVPPCMKAS